MAGAACSDWSGNGTDTVSIACVAASSRTGAMAPRRAIDGAAPE
jgi:hypothetical protein